jgi:hypothetical protein
MGPVGGLEPGRLAGGSGRPGGVRGAPRRRPVAHPGAPSRARDRPGVERPLIARPSVPPRRRRRGRPALVRAFSGRRARRQPLGGRCAAHHGGRRGRRDRGRRQPPRPGVGVRRRTGPLRSRPRAPGPGQAPGVEPRGEPPGSRRGEPHRRVGPPPQPSCAAGPAPGRYRSPQRLRLAAGPPRRGLRRGVGPRRRDPGVGGSRRPRRVVEARRDPGPPSTHRPGRAPLLPRLAARRHRPGRRWRGGLAAPVEAPSPTAYVPPITGGSGPGRGANLAAGPPPVEAEVRAQAQTGPRDAGAAGGRRLRPPPPPGRRRWR